MLGFEHHSNKALYFIHCKEHRIVRENVCRSNFAQMALDHSGHKFADQVGRIYIPWAKLFVLNIYQIVILIHQLGGRDVPAGQ